MNQLPMAPGRSDIAQCPIAALDAEADHIIRWCRSGAHEPIHGDWSLLNVPSERQRNILRTRREAIVSVMKFNKAKVAKAVSDMLKCYFAHIPKERDEFEKLVTKFVQELQDIPTWAVEVGCMKIRMGQAPDVSPSFPPTTILVRQVLLPPVNALRDEANTIHHILMAGTRLPPKETTPEERKRVVDGLKELSASLAAKAERDGAIFAAETKAKSNDDRDRYILAEYAAAGVAPVYSRYGLVTPSALKALGKWPKAA